MNDYVNRQVVLDAFGLSDKTQKYGGDHSGYDTRMLYEIQDTLENIPSEDVVRVIRCRECKHYQFADNRAFGFPVKRCEWTGFEDVDDDDFCSRGERKDGDTDG